MSFLSIDHAFQTKLFSNVSYCWIPLMLVGWLVGGLVGWLVGESEFLVNTIARKVLVLAISYFTHGFLMT